MGGSNLFRNIMVNADANKNSMYYMYPEGTEYASAYLESRGGPYGAAMFVGLQAFLKEYLTHPITVEDVEAAEKIVTGHNARFPKQAWLDLIEDHGGYLPLEIEAVPEGTVVPIRNVMMQVVNTDPKYAWLVSFVECALQRALWYPCTVGTISWQARQAINGALERTSDSPAETARLYLHDYGARGSNSLESAGLGGMAHLVNFDQSDTMAGFVAAQYYYNADKSPAGASMFLEHSNTSSFGPEHETDAFRMLLKDKAAGVVGLLADTYDHHNAVKNIIGTELKDEVLSYPGLVAVRCDSGDPITTPVETVETLMECLGSSTNSKGFKLLPPNVRVVQGDGLDLQAFAGIYAELERRGLASDNVLCGMGAGLLQAVTRDTLNFGYKASAVCISGEWKGIAKKPTGSSMKHSKAGRLALQYIDGDYRTVLRESIPAEDNVMIPIFRNGEILKTWEFSELKARSERPTPEYYYNSVASTLSAAAS
ncbi:nicotinate phosphoribosyltransferase [Gordonia sp. zg691]|uniref:nicotinate phosphoribosyltransferase n=1 Tax=Gordonia jinghuaiqii TaxID=2758710 RepID=UPI0016626EF6|nr:nicotinate phosphoribosyltransferase [Gordonia jinghuaiqii]MBD0863642.1 nicotinate phosphoribosyltransferase [Gordonia jinghuaiqii]